MLNKIKRFLNIGLKPSPTDLEIFEYIYDEYYDDFVVFDREKNKIRETKNFISLDIEKIAKHFRVDKDIIFARLYYVYKKRYDYKKENDHNVSFFLKSIKDELNVINFPYMSSILADLRHKKHKFNISIIISILALAISILSNLDKIINLINF